MPMIVTEKLPGRLRNRPLKDYAGMRFGRLVALHMVERDASAQNNHLWRFACDCGQQAEVRIRQVRASCTRSCGCIAREVLVARNTTHGMSRDNSAEYRIWKEMRARCNTPSNPNYRDYGGRGIRVSAAWDDFTTFYRDMGRRPDGLTIDRIDVNGNYEPGNCRWATQKTQANNKRSNHLITRGGVTKTLQTWCDEIGIEPSKVRYRLKQGWAPERAFSLKDHRKA